MKCRVKKVIHKLFNVCPHLSVDKFGKCEQCHACPEFDFSNLYKEYKPLSSKVHIITLGPIDDPLDEEGKMSKLPKGRTSA